MTVDTEPPPEGDGELAVEFAKKIASKWKHTPSTWRDFVGAAWGGIRRARAAGQTRTGNLFQTAWFDVVTQLRHETEHRKVVKTVQFVCFENGVDFGAKGYGRAFDSSHSIPDHRSDPTDTLPVRLLRFWCETRKYRLQMPMRERIVVYLWAVEGLTMKEIGATLGLSASRISQMTAGFQEAVRYGIEVEKEIEGRMGDEGRGGEGPCGGAPGGGPGGTVEHAGDAAEGGPHGGGAGGGGETADTGRVVGPVRVVVGTTGRVGGGDGRGETGDGTEAENLHMRTGTGGVRPAGEAVETGDRGADPGPVPADAHALVRTGRRSVDTVALELPIDVNRKAAALRAAMLDGIGAADVAEVVALVTRKAKAGDPAAIKLFFGLLGK